jgi:hypothetical protein
MRLAGAVIGLMVAIAAVTAMPGSTLACDDVHGQKITPVSDRLEGKIAALLIAEVAGPSSDVTSLGVTLLVRSDDRLVTVIVLEGAQIVSADGSTLTVEQIPLAATVLLTGRWTNEETFEATRVEIQ